jgi:CRISPR/Cas system CMR-associated protein Cmr3 (group 5 of RAMP superfamily)
LLYFLTPAYFQDGWLSANLSAFVGDRARLVSAAVERYQSIGGWELEPGTARGRAKTTRRCIPAGSIYYFDRSVSVNCPVTEYGWQIGYGITYTGAW